MGHAGKLMDLRERWRVRLVDAPKAAQLIDALFVNPYISVARAQRVLKVSNPTARQTVARLAQLGMLSEITGRASGRLYLARPLLKVPENVGARPGRGGKGGAVGSRARAAAA